MVAGATFRDRRSVSAPVWLWLLAPILTLGPFYWLMGPATAVPTRARVIAACLWALAMLPTLWFLSRPPRLRRPVPLLPILGGLYGLYYALQLVLGADNVNPLVSLDPATDYVRPAELALIGWILLLLGAFITTLAMPSSAPERPPRWRVAELKWWATVLQIGGLAVDVARYELPVPAVLGGLLNFAGILALFGTAILVVLDARGHLKGTERVRLWIIVAGILIVQAGTGSVANLARSGLSILLARFLGGARLRPGLVVIGVLLAIVVITLRGFAIEFREHAWRGGDLSQGERTFLWYNLVRAHADQNGVMSVIAHGSEVTATRTANVDLFADVIRQTPESVPYWRGYTYLSLVGAFVPRMLWPDKPQKRIGQDFGHRYGYLYAHDRNTSINLSFLVEFYANFGERGVLVGMLLVGSILAILERFLNRPGQGWLRSLCALVLLVPLVTNVESDFSLIFGGLILNGAALYAVYRFLIARCAIDGPSQSATASGQVRRQAMR